MLMVSADYPYLSLHLTLHNHTILVMETLEATPVKVQNIKQWTDRDPILSQVRKLVLTGWRGSLIPRPLFFFYIGDGKKGSGGSP